MPSGVEVLDALITIKEYCKKTRCDKCAINRLCGKYFSIESLVEWDLRLNYKKDETIFKVKRLSDGEIYEAKYFKDMTEEEIESSVSNRASFKPEYIFIYVNSKMMYMYDREVEIIK